MPDMTGMSIMGLGTTNDAMSLLSNNVNRTANRQNGTGQDFGTVIDTTAMSIMASAAVATQVAPAAVQLPVSSGNERGLSAVEVTVRTMQTRPNDYSRPTQMSETSERIENGVQGEGGEGFDSGLQTALDSAAGQMEEETAARFGITTDEVLNLMNLNGIEAPELLTEEGLTSLVTAISGEDETALLTDGALYEDLQALIETADTLKADLAESFGMTVEGIEDAVAIIAEQAPEADETVTFAEAAEIAEGATDGEEVITFRREETREVRTEGTQEEPKAQAQETVRTVNDTQETQQNANGSQQQQQTGTETSSRSARTAETNTETAANAGVNPTQNFFQAVNEALGVENNAQLPAGQTQGAEVVRQVLEFMRTQVTANTTELEMQLNPQSLGRVHVNLTAQDGGEMVARFTAQTDAARDALASQMPQLLQRFEEQGIRVSEVQVTVEQHAFDSNRDNMGREDQQAEQEKAIGRMSRLRRVQLDLSQMGAEEIAALDDDARVEAEMMAAEGNTVNYRA
ncbi:MAG: flagellar hook-length control protein FliK [Lachnospiraceae bacterium]|nr:flagellar hook-length control protein FliK [Lachnospiraceae bacterium]